MDQGNATSISVCGFWRGAARKFYTFTKWLMGGAPRTYAFKWTSEVEIPFITKVGSWRSPKRISSYAKSQQIDLLFAHFIIADITSRLKNCLFTEIAPRTIYPLYG